VLEAKVFPQGNIYNFDGHGDERPAFLANVGLVAARSHIIVVCKIDIEAKLFGDRFERGGVRFSVAGVEAVRGSDLETRRYYVDHILAQATTVLSNSN
jgi:hypothetical protein